MYSDPSSLSTYRVIADPLGNIGEVKSSVITFSPATTPSRKTRCSLWSTPAALSEPPASAGSQLADKETALPFTETFDTVDFSSCPLIRRQSRMINGVESPSFWPPADAGGSDSLTRTSIVPFNTGDIFSSVKFSLYR